MSLILLISGSLAVEPTRQALERGLPPIDVLEFDTLFDRAEFPTVRNWMALAGLIDAPTRDAINAQVKSWADFLFDRPFGSDDVIANRQFRVASFGVSPLVSLTSAAINLVIGEKLLSQNGYSKIIVGAGSGVDFTIWRQLADQHALPIEFLPVQKKPPWSPMRKIVRWHHRNRRNSSRIKIAPGTKSDELPPDLEVLCASRQAGEILLREGDLVRRRIAVIDPKDLSFIDPDDLQKRRAQYAKWWAELRSHPMPEFAVGEAKVTGQIGEFLIREIYPLHSGIYVRAREVLDRVRPKIILCDTQRGSPERMWALAARDLGIPTVAYTYDHLLDRNYFFVADYLVSDSGRNTLNAVAQGVPRANIVESISHRLPNVQADRREGRKRVLCSDNFYSGDQCTQDPQVSYHLYQAVIQAAREMPEVDFVLKFHPLRQKKSELRNFIGMDEQELANRKRYLHSLSPPKNFRTVEPEAGILDWLKRADALINIESLTGIEAFTMGIPVVFLRPPSAQDFPLLEEYGAASYPSSQVTLADRLIFVLGDSIERQDLIRRQHRYVTEFYWRSKLPLGEAALQVARTARSEP